MDAPAFRRNGSFSRRRRGRGTTIEGRRGAQLALAPDAGRRAGSAGTRLSGAACAGEARGRPLDGRRSAVLKLAIFDIDGTLTATNDVDSDGFLKSVSGLLGDAAISTDWQSYPEVTDQSLFEHLCRHRLGRIPTPDEIRCAQEALVAYFATVFAMSPAAFAAIRGAAQFVRALEKRPDWRVVLATGAWECSAKFKLRAVGLGHLPLVACDSAATRAEIVQKGIELSSRSVRGFERIVLIGDAPWDLATARTLHLPFVGVASGDRREVLIQQGASHVLSDFSDNDTAMEALEASREPKGSAA